MTRGSGHVWEGGRGTLCRKGGGGEYATGTKRGARHWGGKKDVNVARDHNPPTHELRIYLTSHTQTQPPRHPSEPLQPSPPPTHTWDRKLFIHIPQTTTTPTPHQHPTWWEHARPQPSSEIVKRQNQCKPPSAPIPPGAMPGHEHQVPSPPRQPPPSPPSLHSHKTQALRAQHFLSPNKLLGI